MTGTDTTTRPLRVAVDMNGFGRVRLDVTTDPDTGTSWYQVSAPRVSGTITIVHDPARHTSADAPGGHRTYRDLPPSPDTGRAHLDYGHRPAHQHRYGGNRLDDPLTVNGVALSGGTAADLSRLDDGRLTGHMIACHRPTGPYTSRRPPEATATRAALVVTAVLTHWRTRPDGPALREAAVRAAAPAYLRAVEDRRADLTAKLADLQRRLDETDADLAAARTLTPPTTTPAR